MIRQMFTSNEYQDVIASTSDLSVVKGIKIYPNPAQDFVVIQAGTQLQLEASIYDLSGRLLHKTRLSPNGRVSISNLANGAYIFIIEDEAGKQGSKKLIVNK